MCELLLWKDTVTFGVIGSKSACPAHVFTEIGKEDTRLQCRKAKLHHVLSGFTAGCTLETLSFNGLMRNRWGYITLGQGASLQHGSTSGHDTHFRTLGSVHEHIIHIQGSRREERPFFLPVTLIDNCNLLFILIYNMFFSIMELKAAYTEFPGSHPSRHRPDLHLLSFRSMVISCNLRPWSIHGLLCSKKPSQPVLTIPLHFHFVFHLIRTQGYSGQLRLLSNIPAGFAAGYQSRCDSPEHPCI